MSSLDISTFSASAISQIASSLVVTRYRQSLSYNFVKRSTMSCSQTSSRRINMLLPTNAV
uniref:Uncharacterized protein n=1 Tax=Arundo donax TaxID=35708 RepID=A0A0A9FG64_ARUDO